jgi:hypothetical protein
MSTQTRAGIRAARALLSLLEENSAKDFEAAEAILGGERDLKTILQLLRKFKDHEEEPLSLDRLREIVRREILDLPLSSKDMVHVSAAVLGDERMRAPPRLTVESVLDQVLTNIEAQSPSPGGRVDMLTELLIRSSIQAGPEHATKVPSLLRDLTIQALTENLVLFPTLHALSQLRTRWAEEPLPYKHQEPRRGLVSRLLMDAAQRPAKQNQLDIIRMLLREGLRGPADAELAAVRRMKLKKAHGE